MYAKQLTIRGTSISQKVSGPPSRLAQTLCPARPRRSRDEHRFWASATLEIRGFKQICLGTPPGFDCHLDFPGWNLPGFLGTAFGVACRTFD